LADVSELKRTFSNKGNNAEAVVPIIGGILVTQSSQIG
jgi:hypothetical protein